LNDELKFSYEDDFFGGVLIKENGEPLGYSAPALVIEENTQMPYIIANNYNGNLYLINGLDKDVFTINDSIFSNIKTPGVGGVAVYDFNNDGFLEMLIGNVNGGLNFYSQKNEIISVSNYTQNVIKVYPNPATTTLYITNSSTTTPSNIQIFDCTGKLVFGENGINNKLNIQHLNRGLYILKLQKNEHISYQRFLKH